MKKIIGAQGEITIIQITALPEGMTTVPAERSKSGSWIVSHSESGNHHILTGGEVMERTDNVPPGMRVLYAILHEPASLIQDAAVPHEGFHDLSGIIEFRISREFDPFSEQVRQVAD